MQDSTPASRDLMRAINRSIVLNAIKTLGPVARTEVARQSGLSAATITAIVGELIEEQLVIEKEAGSSSGGRRPILLAINPAGGYVVGVKLTEHEAIGALTDLEANILAAHTVALADHSPHAVVALLCRLVDDLIETRQGSRERLLGIGVGLAGIVDPHTGVLRQSPFLGWHDLPLRELVQAEMQVPVYVENDVNTLTLAEKWFGAGQGIRDFLVLTVGRGIGMGIVANGQFYRGSHGGAGEFGHTVVQPGGRPCTCGKSGCLETLVGDPGLLLTAQEAFTRADLAAAPATIADLVALANGGHATAQAILADAGACLGQALAGAIQILNPQRIIVGGEGTALGDSFFAPLRTALRDFTMPLLYADLDVLIEPWGNEAWARGAASLALLELFESPIRRERATADGP